MYNLNYYNMKNNYFQVLEYCLKFSDTFSVITSYKKNIKGLLLCEHDNTMSNWQDCLVKQEIGIKKWPGTQTKDTRKVMNIYNSRKFRTNFIDLPNFFLPIENNLPEDICFYRNNSVWLYTISHEEIAFMQNASKKDIEVFKALGIVEAPYSEDNSPQ